MADKDPITCHVLDTTTGKPGPNIAVTLSFLTDSEICFTGRTNVDGRIMNWTPRSPNQADLASAIASKERKVEVAGHSTGVSLWKLRFETGEYYGFAHTIFPVVELTVKIIEGEHFHVPLLLGPYSYTTYRGS